MNKATPIGCAAGSKSFYGHHKPMDGEGEQDVGDTCRLPADSGLMPLSSVTSSLILLQWAEPALAAGNALC